MNKIVLLGASGFIGENIVRYFTNKGLQVISFSSAECNLLEKSSVDSAFRILDENDTLIIASCITRLVENSVESMNKNILMIQNIIERLQKIKINQIIFLSTIDIYGLVEDGVLIDESTALNPNDYYSTSKLVGEFLLKTFCKNMEITLSIVRLSGVFGNGDNGKSTISQIFQSVKHEKQVIIFGDGSLERDFLYVDDLCFVLYEIIDKKIDITLNLATGKSSSIKEITEIFFSIFQERENIVYKKNNTKSNFKRVNNLHFDISKLLSTIPSYKPSEIAVNIAEYIKLRIKDEKPTI